MFHFENKQKKKTEFYTSIEVQLSTYKFEGLVKIFIITKIGKLVELGKMFFI